MLHSGAWTPPVTKTRLIEEVINAGGEKVLADLSADERKLWNEQALVISCLRDHGDLGKAALESGHPVDVVFSWYNDSTSLFKGRCRPALQHLGWKLRATMLERIHSGSVKNGTIIKFYQEELNKLGSGTEDEGEGLIGFLERKALEKIKKLEAESATARSEQLIEGELVSGDDDSELPPILKLPQRRLE